MFVLTCYMCVCTCVCTWHVCSVFPFKVWNYNVIAFTYSLVCQWWVNGEFIAQLQIGLVMVPEDTLGI